MMAVIKSFKDLIKTSPETIRVIDIENQLAASHWESVWKCENLEKIYLTGCQLSEIQVKLFTLPKLRTVEFR